MVGMVYIGNQDTLVHTQYRNCRSRGLREDIFFCFPHYKSMEANDLRGGASLDPKVMVDRFYLEDYLASLYILNI